MTRQTAEPLSRRTKTSVVAAVVLGIVGVGAAAALAGPGTVPDRTFTATRIDSRDGQGPDGFKSAADPAGPAPGGEATAKPNAKTTMKDSAGANARPDAQTKARVDAKVKAPFFLPLPQVGANCRIQKQSVSCWNVPEGLAPRAFSVAANGEGGKILPKNASTRWRIDNSIDGLSSIDHVEHGQQKAITMRPGDTLTLLIPDGFVPPWSDLTIVAMQPFTDPPAAVEPVTGAICTTRALYYTHACWVNPFVLPRDNNKDRVLWAKGFASDANYVDYFVSNIDTGGRNVGHIKSGELQTITLHPNDVLSIIGPQGRPNVVTDLTVQDIDPGSHRAGPGDPSPAGGRPRVGQECTSDPNTSAGTTQCWWVNRGAKQVAFGVLSQGNSLSRGYASPNTQYVIKNLDGLTKWHTTPWGDRAALTLRPGDYLYLANSPYKNTSLTVESVQP